MRRTASFVASFSTKPLKRTRHFVLRLNDNGLTHARLGIIVSKRFCKRAVERNMIKRVAREIFRFQFNFFAPVDVLFRLQKGFSRTEFFSRSAIKARCITELTELITYAVKAQPSTITRSGFD
jgi:ribonuclease P protein component